MAMPFMKVVLPLFTGVVAAGTGLLSITDDTVGVGADVSGVGTELFMELLGALAESGAIGRSTIVFVDAADCGVETDVSDEYGFSGKPVLSIGLISNRELDELFDEPLNGSEISAKGFDTVCGSVFFGIATRATPTAQNIVTTEHT